MPRTQVGQFSGDGIYGSAGEYRYDHPDGTAVHVARDPESDDDWLVAIDKNNTGAPGTVASGLSKNDAFQHAYGWMNAHSGSSMGVSL